VHAQTHDGAVTKVERNAPAPAQCDESHFECVAVGITSGSAAFGTLLANKIGTDQLMVNGFDPLKLDDATLSALQRKGVLTAAEVQGIVEAGKVIKPLRLKTTPQ
jgi:hypothetical protein